MITMRSILVLLGLCLLYGPARAQLYCPSSSPTVQCGDVINGDTTNGQYAIPSHLCNPTIVAWGPELTYRLVLTDVTEVTVTVDPISLYNATLSIVPPHAALGCDPSLCIVGSNVGPAGAVETVTTVLTPGTYWIIVDGETAIDFEPFSMTIDCDSAGNCQDNDSDTFMGYHVDDCPWGDDCCDTGSESSLGCSPATAAGINPAASEVCEDGIDQNCDGQDEACPPCGIDLTVGCAHSGAASTDEGKPTMDDYCNLGQSLWGAREYLFGFTPSMDCAAEFTVDNMGAEQLDLFGLAGECDPTACLDYSLATTGTQQVVFWVQAGQLYSFSVDGRDGAHGSFDYSLVCLEESCTADAALTCGDQVSGDNSAGSNSVSAYPGMPHRLLAPEYVYTLATLVDYQVTATLTVDAPDPPDLALLVIEEDAGGDCLPGNVIGASDQVQDSSANPPEVVTFQSVANTVYFVVVDGWNPDSTGSYSLAVDCLVECPDGLTECNGECVDLNTDVNHCGECDNLCEFPHAEASCVNGSCVMGDCYQGWYDCNLLPEDGCETDLVADSQNCGECGNACLDGQFCMGGKCVQECPDGFMDCGGGCIDVNGDNVHHCGGCFQECLVANGTPACDQGTCVIESCDAGFADCVNGYADGCETVLGTDQNCSDCGDACEFPNGLGFCDEYVCQLGACDDGYGDCNDDVADGCETQLGTAQHCSACDDACEYAHAPGFCIEGVCLMGECEEGWADCNLLPSDGCESDLSSDSDNCGSCDAPCDADEICVDGQCVFCVDADGDGYHDQECGGDDCDDTDDSINPGAEEICHDGIDQDCDGDDSCGCPDADGDGYLDEECGGDDCDDSNGFINPGAQDECGDGIDQDCSGEDLACACADSDGDDHTSNACGGDDCNDNNNSIFPGAYDECGDGIDQDCDGADAQCSSDGCGCSGGTGAPSGLLWVLVLLPLAFRRPD